MIYDDFIDWLEERELANNTIENYKYGLKQFFERYSEFNKHNFIKFKKELMGRVKPRTAAIRITALNEYGYIIAGEDCLTDTTGVFVAGDCRTKSVRQVTTATADGAVAALAACRYVDSLE